MNKSIKIQSDLCILENYIYNQFNGAVSVAYITDLKNQKDVLQYFNNDCDKVCCILNKLSESTDVKYLIKKDGALIQFSIYNHINDDIDKKRYTSITIYYKGYVDIENTQVYKDIMDLESSSRSYNNKLNLVSMSRGELYLKTFTIKNKIDIDLNLNYNDDFYSIHELIKDKITNTNKGIIMLHGLPGTGKTSYIKWFLQNTPKKVVFLPPNLTNQLSSPSFVDFVSERCNDSLLVIEDAENVLESRRSGGSEAVSNLLNITDGLLSDIFNIQILATFNSKLSSIDNALKRKGRIIAEYEFKELKKEKAQMLSNHLGYNTIIEKDMILTDIFNQNEIDFTNKIKRAGF